MPLRYFVFATVVLAAAFGFSNRLAKTPMMERESNDTDAAKISPLVVEKVNAVTTLSGSSIAPGGAGGRQSQFSAVLVD